MLSLLVDIYKIPYSSIQLIHMYKQLYTTKNIIYAGGSYTIMFYAIKFYMFICSVQHMNNCTYIQLCVFVIGITYAHMSIYLYVVYMNVCTYVHMWYITLVVHN